ncbi:MAG: hypothetical protein R6X18_00885 [Chloroflexota bacterium]|jgi:hypothetical protein
MNFNDLENSRLVAEDHMRHVRREAEKNLLLASAKPSLPEDQLARAGCFSLRRLFSWFRFGRRNTDQAQPL